jgi:hypothetical protein
MNARPFHRASKYSVNTRLIAAPFAFEPIHDITVEPNSYTRFAAAAWPATVANYFTELSSGKRWILIVVMSHGSMT